MTHPPRGLYAGLMSGTSVDAIDTALVRIDQDIALEHCHSHPLPPALRDAIAAISHSGADEIERLGVLDRQLGALFAEATLALLESANTAPEAVTAIGSHGQTVRHRPPSGGHSREEAFTLQLADPNTIAELTGITTVADFRRRDIAAGGEGAPLAPAFHAQAFSSPGSRRAVVNIGGISNISLLDGQTLVAGFDSGPGNTLMDHWIQRHLGEPFDRDGAWAATGKVDHALLALLLQHPYLALRGPRSTGKEAFNLAWLDEVLEASGSQPGAADVQATLALFTAQTIAAPVLEEHGIDAVFVCGGGAHNRELMRVLGTLLAPIAVASTEALGIAPDWVEAATFAWLASRTMAGLHGNAPAVTGASEERILGGVYPGRGPAISATQAPEVG
ncbi:anhydro-N-acetylmuramic acid kinase [Mangrovimicrobium sediminis]|uniref:Anhydro-N-acetylmuramic acid kinase n=1 Tax=Mangrovimicrobium sediminis TaxID=2562682 RepID=A0A4Z0LZ37_9GAMM|nr:anhydro-N-acetylmuramic acid kinase [Haliea sp. SAOS-164]TGD72436.1 anhydro-N-acetylmuramic acid kinase [Haliea sp. SAOS-164]